MAASGGMLDVAVIDDPAAAEASLDPMRARLLAALAEPGSATHARRQGRAVPPAAELPPAGAGAPRAGRARGGAPQGQLHRARAPRHRRLVRDLAGRLRGRRARSRALAGPGVGALDARARGPAGARRRRPDLRRPQGAQAGRDLRDRQRDPLRVGGRPRRVRRRAGRGGRAAGRPVPRRRAPRAAASTGSSSRCTRASPAPRRRPRSSDHGQGVRDQPRGGAAGARRTPSSRRWRPARATRRGCSRPRSRRAKGVRRPTAAR